MTTNADAHTLVSEVIWVQEFRVRLAPPFVGSLRRSSRDSPPPIPTALSLLQQEQDTLVDHVTRRLENIRLRNLNTELQIISLEKQIIVKRDSFSDKIEASCKNN